MCKMISCLVGRRGAVYAFDGIHSHTAIASRAGVDEDKCLKYEYDLKFRELEQDFDAWDTPFEAKQSHDNAAMEFFNQCAQTPKKLIAYVRRGNWDADILYYLLTPEARDKYSDLIGLAEKRSQKELQKAYDRFWKNPSQAAYKIRKKAIKLADQKNEKAAIKSWLKLFSVPENRIDVWR